MKLLKLSLAAAVCAAVSLPTFAVELDGLMTVNPKLIGLVPILDDNGDPVLDPTTGEIVYFRKPRYIEGSYFAMGANNPNNSASQEGGPAGGITLGTHQPFVLSPDVPHPPSGTGYAGTPASLTTAMQTFQFFGVNTYIGLNAVSYQSGNAKPAPSATVDAAGNLSVELSSWEVIWNGSVFEQGPRVSAATGFAPATGTYDYETGNYSIGWVSKIVGGPFSGVPGHWHLEGTILADPADATVLAEPQTLNVKSNGNGFSVSVSLTDPDGNVIPASSINDGISIISIGSVEIPEGNITENVASRLIEGDTVTASFDDANTGNRQDIIASVTDVTNGSYVDVCVAGKARDGDGILRPFEDCDAIKIINKGNP